MQIVAHGPGCKPLEPHRNLAEPAAEFLQHTVSHAAADERFAYRVPHAQPGRWIRK